MDKKSFKGVSNPAMKFISTASGPTAPEVPAPATESKEGNTSRKANPPVGYKVVYVEKKSCRFSMLMTPTLMNAVKKRAKEEKISANALIHEILEKELFGEE